MGATVAEPHQRSLRRRNIVAGVSPGNQRGEGRRCGLPPRSKLWSAQPMLYGISPCLLPKPAGWPSDAFMCGRWVRRVKDWDAPQSLQDFLAAGEAPIYVGFGSMVSFDRKL